MNKQQASNLSGRDKSIAKRARGKPLEKGNSYAWKTGQSGNPAGRSIAKRAARGKPFEKGNGHAWKTGQSGNPAGRPKFRTLSEAYRSLLAQVDPNDPQQRTYAEQIAEHICKLAMGLVRGNSAQAAREIGDRTEGKPRQAVQLDAKNASLQYLAALLGCSVDELPAPAP